MRGRVLGAPVVVLMLGMLSVLGAVPARAQDSSRPPLAAQAQNLCGPNDTPKLEPLEDGVRTIALGRRKSIFNIKPIEYRVTGCRLPNKQWQLAVYGADLRRNDFSASLVTKTADTASLIFERVRPAAFPPGKFDLTVAVNDPDLSFATAIVVTRQYDNWRLVALAAVAACVIAFVLLALRAAWAGSGVSAFPTFFTKFSNYGTLVIAIPAAYAVYRLRYESVRSWEGLGGDFLALMIAVGGAFMAASTTTTAVTSLGSKTE